MSLNFRAMKETVMQEVTSTETSITNSTGAMAADGTVIKLQYIKIDMDIELYAGGVGSNSWINGVIELGDTGLEFKRLRLGPAGPMEFEWFIPDNFPELVADSITFKVNSNVEALQTITFLIIYEIVKKPDLEILQALENYAMYQA